MSKAPKDQKVLDLVVAQSQTTQDLSERVVKVEKIVERQEHNNDRQESKNQNAFYAVIFAFVLIVVTVAVEVILSTRHEDSVYGGLYDKLMEVDDKASNVQKQIDLLRAKNSYLK